MSNTKVSKNLFKKMFENGALNLKNNYEEIDHLNVFPIPDGDTGTNMQMTMMAAVDEILKANLEKNNFKDLSSILAKAMLYGARGNSGSILSQFFLGFHMALETAVKDEISVSEFINALLNGSKTAYKSVKTPVEGTILTVIRKAGEKVKKEKKNLKTIEEVIKLYLKTAKDALDKTPELLPVLKQAGVVDSGGAGFVKIIEGMEMALNGVFLEDKIANQITNQNSFEFEDVHRFTTEEIKFCYCTEFIIKLYKPNEFKEKMITDILENIGDSIVVALLNDLLKIHVHTNQPGIAITLAQKYGDLQKIKVENMRLQNKQILEEAKEKELKKDKNLKKYGLIAVCSGKGLSDVFEDFGVDYIIKGGQTMNPSTNDFVKAIESLNAEHIIIIPNNSNIIMAAEQTKQIFPDKDIRVIKTKNIGQGFASINVFDELSDVDLNFDNMHEAIKESNTAEITYAVRDTEINNIKIKKGEYIGICDGDIKVCEPNLIDTFKKTILKIYQPGREVLTIFYGKDTDNKDLKEIKKFIGENYSNLEFELIEGSQEIYNFIIVLE